MRRRCDQIFRLRSVICGQELFLRTGLRSAAMVTKSVVIALALAESHIMPFGAWSASMLNENYRSGRWGEDLEKSKRRTELRIDPEAAGRFMAIVWH